MRGFEGPESDYDPILSSQQPSAEGHSLRIARRALALAAAATRLKSRDKRRQYLAWVMEQSREPWGFRWCCDVAGVRPNWITKALQAGLIDA